MKSNYEILVEEINKMLKQKGLKEMKYDKEKRGGQFVYIKQRIPLSKFIIHIPHSSLKVPKEFRERLLVDDEYFEKENKYISDYKIDEFVPKDYPNIVKFNYYRMFCDVERYLDDSKEEMSKYGMGAIYIKDSNGDKFIKLDKEYRQFVIDKYYKKHHENIDLMVEKLLKIYNDCFIIDLHSFSDEFVNKMFNKNNNPDICIGINKSNYDIYLLEKTINHFSSYGYSVMINYPYSGSIISNKYPDVKSIMIEVNKRVYLDNKEHYNKFHDCMKDFFDMLKIK